MNLNKLMKQAQQMQAGMQKAQEDLAKQTVESSVAGGKVSVTATGAGDVTNISIDPAIIDPEDADFLETVLLQGVQEAITKAKDLSNQEMGKLTGGMNLPNMGL